jgi:hypothetical protein
LSSNESGVCLHPARTSAVINAVKSVLRIFFNLKTQKCDKSFFRSSFSGR